MKHIIIFSSGAGSNAEAICRYFKDQNRDARVCAIVSNKETAGVHDRAKHLDIPSYTFSKADLTEGTKPLKLLHELKCDLLVLAGYMCLITEPYFTDYTGRILNIHPALLPRFGGQGMYGERVHRAVLAAGEVSSGITIHLVDEMYDHGRTLCRATCPVFPDDTPDTLASRVHKLEHRYYPLTVDQYLCEIEERDRHSRPEGTESRHNS